MADRFDHRTQTGGAGTLPPSDLVAQAFPPREPVGGTIEGPPRPPVTVSPFPINVEKAFVYEGLFRDFRPTVVEIDWSKGFLDLQNNCTILETLDRVFQSLTGYPVRSCVTLQIGSEEQYRATINRYFGESFQKIFGFDPMEIQGINIDGTWVIMREKRDFAMMADLFHEVGHRVYWPSVNSTAMETGANYFMFLCLEKLKAEFSLMGLTVPPIDFGSQVTNSHTIALEVARNLVERKYPYIHEYR